MAHEPLGSRASPAYVMGNIKSKILYAVIWHGLMLPWSMARAHNDLPAKPKKNGRQRPYWIEKGGVIIQKVWSRVSLPGFLDSQLTMAPLVYRSDKLSPYSSLATLEVLYLPGWTLPRICYIETLCGRSVERMSM